MAEPHRIAFFTVVLVLLPLALLSCATGVTAFSGLMAAMPSKDAMPTRQDKLVANQNGKPVPGKGSVVIRVSWPSGARLGIACPAYLESQSGKGRARSGTMAFSALADVIEVRPVFHGNRTSIEWNSVSCDPGEGYELAFCLVQDMDGRNPRQVKVVHEKLDVVDGLATTFEYSLDDSYFRQPAPPAEFRANLVQYRDRQSINFSWQDMSRTEARFVVEAVESGLPWENGSPLCAGIFGENTGCGSCPCGLFTPGRSYKFRIRAENAVPSAWVECVNAVSLPVQ